MRFLTAAHTDVGTVKKVNQDAFCLLTAHAPGAKLVFAVLCDGMGGLQHGELASAFTVNAFVRWFEEELPTLLQPEPDLSAIRRRWQELIERESEQIRAFGSEHGGALGTTLTAFLAVNDRCVFAQVGDSRLYRLSGGEIRQLTRDQTLVAREVELGRLTPEQARVDKRKHILTQAVGTTGQPEPDFGRSALNPGEVYLLCSDGFRHEISEREMLAMLGRAGEESDMCRALAELTQRCKARGERDNITALLIRTESGGEAPPESAAPKRPGFFAWLREKLHPGQNKEQNKGFAVDSRAVFTATKELL